MKPTLDPRISRHTTEIPPENRKIAGLTPFFFASANTGGGKDPRKPNSDRVASAKSKEQTAREDLAALKSKPNKTQADKKEIQRLENVIKKEQSRQQKSQTHGRKGEEELTYD